MSNEELEQKAEEYVEKKVNTDSDFEKSILFQAYKDGYKQGQKETEVFGATYFIQKNEQLEKENSELKAQIRLIESVADANADKIEELKDKIKRCNELLYSDGISDSEICSKIMEIL